jgi:hypothetical protein
MISRRPERQEIERLLPWHAARTLSRREADLVERALAADSELARRYDLVRQELAETIHLNETLGAPSARAMDKLFAAIEAEETRAPRRRHQRISRTPSRNNYGSSAHSGSLPTATPAPPAAAPPRRRADG